MSETRVDLKHLLEDIRDGYPYPVEEAILAELIANSLDSKSSPMSVRIEPERRRGEAPAECGRKDCVHTALVRAIIRHLSVLCGRKLMADR